MDALDIRILRTMGVIPYGPHPKNPDVFRTSYIADQIGKTPKTVRARLRAMEEEGIIKGYQVTPNFDRLGLTVEGHYFVADVETVKDDVIESAIELSKTTAVHDYLGDGICVEFAYSTPEERANLIETISQLCGDPNPRQFYNGVVPDVSRELTHLDWRILSSLRWEATKRLREVAAELDVSRRTVKRRYDRMANEGSFVPVVMLDPGQVTGRLFFVLLFFFESRRDQSEVESILEAYQEHYIFSYTPETPSLGHLGILMFAETPSEVARLRRRGEEYPGVERVKAWFYNRFEDHSEWMDGAITARIEATTPGSS